MQPIPPKIGWFIFCEIFPSFSFPQKWISMTWISSSSLADFYKMILRRLPVRVEEHQILESFKKTGKRCTVMKFYAICWLCVKTGIHKLTQCELSRCSRRFFADWKQDKLRSIVLGWILSREGYGLLRWNIWSVSRNSIPFAIQTSVTVTSFIITNEISTSVLCWTLKFQCWNQRFVKYFRCEHILEKLCGCQQDDFETIVTQGSVVFCIWSWLSLSYVVSLLTCRRSVQRISRNGNDVLWVTYWFPLGVEHWTKLSSISCDKTLPYSKTE